MRLRADIFVSAYLRRCAVENVSAVLRRRGAAAEGGGHGGGGDGCGASGGGGAGDIGSRHRRRGSARRLVSVSVSDDHGRGWRKVA